ncbi:DUF4855 domain-containing protein [Paenibacillus abyssi]|uniref:Dockerin n=1 Tax=Paenibacillus abyssi TaxID=1340531 RepID=A0A917CWA2_9BACL|nr:DUF4855 domain-containing protein [Paenibacillus abyssi]GGG00458.1 hypothetical protein GCM10010916_17060 [Paenibacillus abyssi]
MKRKQFIAIVVVLAVMLTLKPMEAEAAYFPPGSSQGGGIEDLVLIYNGYYNPANYGGEDISAWPREQFKPYTAFVDRLGQRQEIFFRDYLFLGLQGANGRSFHREADASKAGLKSDWQWYLDRTFTTNMQQLNALNEETKAAATELGQPNLKNNVVIMVPFANENVTNFGDVDGDGVSENLTTLANREKVTRWYIDQVLSRFSQANYSHLQLKGFYWLKEDMDTTKADEVNLVKNTANYIHSKGNYIFCWIPWSQAYAATQWASFNFDFAILQPNHFVNRSNTTTPETIKNSANKSYHAGMGVEIEFDGQILRSDKYRERFYDYLNGGLEFGFMNGSILAYYQDARGVYDLTQQPEIGYPIYEDLYRFAKGNYVTDKQVSTMLNTFESLPFPTSPSAATSISTEQYVQGQKAMKINFGNYATSVITGSRGADFSKQDWSKYDSFRIDVYNPQTVTGYVTVLIGDQSGKQHYKYAPLHRSSWNTVRISIEDLAAGTGGSSQEPGTVPIDVTRIDYIKLVQRSNANYLPLPNTYYFDNMRLVQDDGARLNDLEWQTFGGNNSVTLSKTAATIREQNTAMQVHYGLYNVAQAWIEAPTHFKLKDWSNQEAFKVDVYNPNSTVMNLGLKFTDSNNQTYYRRVALQPNQWNTVQIPIAHLAAGMNATVGEGTSSALAINSLQRVDFYQRNNSNYAPLPNHLFFDNIRLGVLEP